jgi:hypothetical protein
MRRLCPLHFAVEALFLALLMAAIIAPSSRSAASDLQPNGVGPREVWVGADASAHNWLVYTGGTYAPFGDIHGDGFRMRATAGYGQYDYKWDASTAVKVDKTYADALIGYQQRFGELTAKGFVGWAVLSDIDVPSAQVRRAAIHDGIKGAVELWLNLGSQAWTSLDLNYADTRDTWSVRSRTGYRILPTVSAGVELNVNHANLAGQVQVNAAAPELMGTTRAGGFVRYEWFGGEISASGGLTGELTRSRSDPTAIDPLHRPSAYGTLNFIMQF